MLLCLFPCRGQYSSRWYNVDFMNLACDNDWVAFIMLGIGKYQKLQNLKLSLPFIGEL